MLWMPSRIMLLRHSLQLDYSRRFSLHCRVEDTMNRCDYRSLNFKIAPSSVFQLVFETWNKPFRVLSLFAIRICHPLIGCILVHDGGYLQVRFIPMFAICLNPADISGCELSFTISSPATRHKYGVVTRTAKTCPKNNITSIWPAKDISWQVYQRIWWHLINCNIFIVSNSSGEICRELRASARRSFSSCRKQSKLAITDPERRSRSRRWMHDFGANERGGPKSQITSFECSGLG